MTIATFLSRRRRLLAICVASALLHYLAIGWVGARIGPDSAAPDKAAPATIQAALLAPPAPPPSPAAVAPVKKVAPRPPAPAAPQPAPEPAPAPSAPEPAPAPEPAVEPAPEQPAAAPPAEAVVAETAPPAAPTVQVFKVSLPPSARLTMDLTRAGGSGAELSGSGEMVWQRRADGYRVTMEASVSLVVTRLNVYALSSEGAIDEHGIAPRESTEKRGRRAPTATHFDRAQQRLTFSTSDKAEPLAPGAQDKASLPLQLAGIARADSAQLQKDMEIAVADERGVSQYRFVLVGQEDIDTPLGRIATWHLSRPPRPGAYNARLDVWLAPRHEWFPVQIRSTESTGAVTTQTVRKIVLTDAGS